MSSENARIGGSGTSNPILGSASSGPD